MQPKSAMVFAAGFGTRMRHLTNDMPKPLVPVLGKPMIDHTLDILSNAGIADVFVNTHYFADPLEQHLKTKISITTIREEPEILETGGGLKNALPQIGTDPVFTMNCDSIWLDGNPIEQLLQSWNPDTMDGLLLILKKPNAQGYLGAGDFLLTDQARLQRKGTAKEAPYVYSGVQIIKTEGLNAITEQCFSINVLWEKMIAEGRLSGAIYDGTWVDVGYPEGIELAEKIAADV
ncbi:nucleotidyltransferase family protein [Amylibacter sp. SFDW26]|uniref:nucleotidyltransferase family protein n=1 Tax=Amylibacter sp. SFDW26 TaxID=2652722 RepID=UPI00126199AF|nr:nucleotidyltransferase family protein [Amylibacter sp. SFDW26]KAB7614619.1 nucleotidyltransferase family protein [Amylibacter sp. SFDW26]